MAAPTIFAQPKPWAQKLLPPEVPKEERLYSIAIDMNIEALRSVYGDPCNGAYLEIRKILEKHGFTWQQDSVYSGGISADACVMAAIDLSKQMPWFAASVRDIRMLRNDESNDLMPAVQQAKE